MSPEAVFRLRRSVFPAASTVRWIPLHPTGSPGFTEPVGKIRPPGDVLGAPSQDTSDGGETCTQSRSTTLTEQTHLLHSYAKLVVNDRAAAVATAYERGLLTPGDA